MCLQLNSYLLHRLRFELERGGERVKLIYSSTGVAWLLQLANIHGLVRLSWVPEKTVAVGFPLRKTGLTLHTQHRQPTEQVQE